MLSTFHHVCIEGTIGARVCDGDDAAGGEVESGGVTQTRACPGGREPQRLVPEHTSMYSEIIRAETMGKLGKNMGALFSFRLEHRIKLSYSPFRRLKAFTLRYPHTKKKSGQSAENRSNIGKIQRFFYLLRYVTLR
jgi:surfactin synthase thioesterase subunit